VPVRGILARLLWWSGAVCAGVLAVVGGIGLRGPGLVAVGVAGLLTACTAVGIARDDPAHDRRSLLESAVQATGWAVGVLLVLAGVGVLAGALVAVLAGVAGGGAWLLAHVLRSRARAARSGRLPQAAPWSTGVGVLLLPVPPPDVEVPGRAGQATSSVCGLGTAALGREWIRTTAALRGRLTPAERQELVRRREETLDELERRDPDGFARWLAEGPAPGSDPAAYVRGRPVQDDPTAGTDAA
jgi:hypothetical protein